MNNNSDISGIDFQEKHKIQLSPSKQQHHPHVPILNEPSLDFQIGKRIQKDVQKGEEIDQEMDERRGSVDPSIFNHNQQEKQINVGDSQAQSKPSSVISRGSSAEGKSQKLGQKLYTTPSVDSKFDAKSSTFDNTELFSGARENHDTSNNGTNEKKVKFIQIDADSQSQPEDVSNQPGSDLKMKENGDFSLSSHNNYNDFALNSSTQKETRFTSQRERRSCRDKTSKYSLTHKGMYTNIQTSDKTQQSQKSSYQRHSTIYPPFGENPYNLSRMDQQEQPGQGNDGSKDIKPIKKSTPKTAEQCLEIIRGMFAFDWTLKDIGNLRHSPHEFLGPILQNLTINNNKIKNQEELKESQEAKLTEQQSSANKSDGKDNEQPDMQQNIEIQKREQLPQYVQTLFRDKKFKKFRKYFKDLQERALQETFKEPDQQIIPPTIKQIQEVNVQNQVVEDNKDIDMNEDNNKAENLNDLNNDDFDQEQQAERKYQIMIELLKREVSNIEQTNRQQLEQQYKIINQAFKKALEAEGQDFYDLYPYRSDQMDQYGIKFLAKVEPSFVQDYQYNLAWYKENYNAILLNIGQPSKLEKDFLRHIEYVQQRKSDQQYKKILKQIEQGKMSGQILRDDDKIKNLSSHKRTLVTQEDAQCAICNNGDYEDEDMIVFCGNCNVPVHQSCYGIEQLPEGDWVCYNCEIFGLKRGIMVSCMLCPKKGGAMKPTNIFTSSENYRRHNHNNGSASTKKSAKKHHHHLIQSQSEKISDSQVIEKRYILGENEDKNLSLTVILNREFDFQSNLREKSVKNDQPLEHLELIFDASEAETQTPEDYSFFLQKNENRLETHPSTQTLYEWVHLSCASWIPGPLVTPKTPVRLNRFDEKRFNLQCIICLKKIGACMQCQATRCTIGFHVECARRNNYCMEIERKDRDKTYKMFCEKHRPLKIVKEMEERDKQNIEEIQKFCKIIDKCMEIDYRHQLKPSKHSDKDKEVSRLKQSKQSLKQTKERVKKDSHGAHGSHRERDKLKKWREKDKKMLFERVKEKYLLFRKMRINIVRIDPFKKLRRAAVAKSSQRKRSKKRIQKKQNKGGCRAGLRSNQNQQEEEKCDDQQMMSEQIDDINDAEEEEKQESTLLGGQDQSEMGGADNTMNIEEQDIHYKLSIPTYPTEMDWTITLSRNDFPWHEIRFANFTAKDCYEKYSSIVKDPSIFLKKVLGMKEKYKKMMQNQIQLAQSSGLVQIPLIGGVQAGQTQAQDQNLYCRCKGQIICDIMVKCDGDEECTNGGWVHPQCTTDLKDKSKEDLDNIQEWYCEDCVVRIKKEDEEENDEHKEEDDLGDDNEDMQIDENDELNDNQQDQEMVNEEQNQTNSRKSSMNSNQDERSSSSSSSSDDDQDNILD